MAILVDYENTLFITTSDLLTKKETKRELRSSIPWLMDTSQATENMQEPLFKNKNIGARPLMLPLQQTDICIVIQ